MTEAVCLPAFGKMTARKLSSQSAEVVTKQISLDFFIFFCIKEELNVWLLANGSTVISAYKIARRGGSFANRGLRIRCTGHTENHFSPKVKLMNHGKVLHSICIDEEIFFCKSLWISLMLFRAIVHDKHLNCIYKMAHKSIAWISK